MRRTASVAAALLALIAPAAPAWAVAVAPDAPASVTATGAENALIVSWAAPASDGGDTITQYTAQAYPDASGGAAVSSCTPASASSLTCTIGSLTSGTTYYVGVTATNGVGTSSESTRASGTAGTTPGVPQSVVATRTIGGAAISWAAPSSTGGSAITSYTAKAYTSTSTSASVAASCTSTGLDCTITGLDSSTVYYVSVSATNAIGTGSESTRRSVAAGDVPGAPTNVKAPRGNGFSKVTWSAPTSNGNSTITRYDVQAWTAASGGTAVANCQPETASALTCNLGPLANGTTYYVDVYARNALGSGSTSSPRVEVTPATTPNTPRDVTATREGGDVVVRWSPPDTDGGLPITSYVATAYSAVTGGTSVSSCTTDGPSCRMSALQGAPVYISVLARTEAGSSPESTPRIKVRLIGSATEPLAVAGSARPEGIAVSWRPPLNDGGRPITHYKATAFTSPTGGQAVNSCVASAKGQQAKPIGAGDVDRLGCTITRLKPNSIYYLEVGAFTEHGVTNTTARTAVRVRQGLPLAPREVSGLPEGKHIDVAWILPASDGGRPIIEYRVQARVEATDEKAAASCTQDRKRDVSAYSCTLAVEKDYEPYWVTVQARTDRGWGASSKAIALEAHPAAPSAPIDVHVAPNSKGLFVDWVAPLGDGGYPVYRYVATAYDAASGGKELGSCTVEIDPQEAEQTPAPTTCTITGLSDDAYVYVQVTAENTVGLSAASARVASTTTVQ